MTDDQLERLLREANPAQTRLDSATEFRRQQILESIMVEPEPEPEPEPRRAWNFPRFGVPLAAFALSALVLVAFFNPFSAAPAVAYGPEPLTYTATTDSLQEVVRSAKNRLSESAGPGSAVRSSASTSWSLVVRDNGEPGLTTYITPIITELNWDEDFSGRRTLVAGEQYAIGKLEVVDAPAPGSIILDEFFQPGEYQPGNVDGGSLNLASMREYVQQYAAPSTTSPGLAMWAATDLLNEWMLTNAQHGYLLDVLLEYEDLTVLGTAKDRAGREVVGVQGLTTKHTAMTLLVSLETGRIVAFETSVTGEGSALDVPPGTVTYYTFWREKP